jgi:lipoyl(octanoyl) transferase
MEYKTSKTLIDYMSALTLMEVRVNEILMANAPELVWFLEHEALITGGSSANELDLLNKQALPVYVSGRGGGYTYHGPGQLVTYLVLNLKKRAAPHHPDIRKYVYTLEQIIINSLNALGVKGYRIAGKIGVWVNVGELPHKIAAIGIRIKKGVAYHGFAVNLAPDLSNFSHIVPCGIKEYGVTSLAQLGVDCSRPKFEELLEVQLRGEFRRE